MSSIVEDYAKNLAVKKFGFSDEQFKIAWNMGVLLVMLETGNIGLAKFLDFSGDPDKGSIEKKIDALFDEIAKVKNDVKVGNYNITYLTIIKQSAHTIDNARPTITTFLNNRSVESRKNISEVELRKAIIQLLDPGFPFIAMVYIGSEWKNGRLAYFRNYTGEGSSPFWYKFQVYQQSGYEFEAYEKPETSLDKEWALPKPLQKEVGPGESKWDGFFSVLVVPSGLRVWQSALLALEPFYRLSGYWREFIIEIIQAMDNFLQAWADSLLWTREMPSLSKITKPGYLFGGEVGGGSYDPLDFPQVGFNEWPCAVLDPVMGIEIINKDKPWWTSNGNLEMMTDQQRTQFKQLRQIQRVKLEDENGFNKFKDIRINIGNLLKPPSSSPSLGVHPDHFRIKKVGGYQIPKYEQVTDPVGNVWNGVVVHQPVIVEVPISVQPNPYGGEGKARRAESETVFGYEISVIVGGTKDSFVWRWPLSFTGHATPAGFQDMDLYHNKDGTIKKVPYTYEHPFSMQASTWKTVTDGVHRDKIDEVTAKVTFNMTVTVCDQIPDKLIPFDESDPEQRLWRDQHGVIWITIDAAMNEEQNRSFEVIIEVKETSAVDEEGNRVTDTSKAKTYTLQLVVPVDIYRINVPTGYFEWLRGYLEALRHVSDFMEIPRPIPDPDAVLELILWRRMLERNPALLQAQVHELRRLTNRPFLMPDQVLAELDAAVVKLSASMDGGRYIESIGMQSTIQITDLVDKISDERAMINQSSRDFEKLNQSEVIDISKST